MKGTCRVVGCTNKVTGRWSVHCQHHTNRLRRHGHPLQEAISKTHIVPYLKEVDRILERNSQAVKGDKVKLEAIDARWDLLVADCHARIAKPGAFERYQRIADRLITRTADEVEARDVWKTVCAMYLMRREQPHRFQSDEAFNIQLLRRVRALGTVSMGSYWDEKASKTKLVFRDHPPKAMTKAAKMIVEVLGPVGLHFCKVLDREEERRKLAVSDFRETIMAID